jgi:transcriptional regulator with XRE-family HTH domain
MSRQFPLSREQLKLKRGACDLTQAQLAERLGVEPKTVSNWETGATRPDYPTAGRLATVLGVEIADLQEVHADRRGAENDGDLISREEALQFYGALQTEHLGSWRLFDFGRDIHLNQIFVQEVLEEARTALFPIPIPVGDPIPDGELLNAVLSRKPKVASRCWVIQGEPGSGKSTVLRSWTLRIYQMIASTRSSHLPTPLFVSLRYLSEYLRSEGSMAVTASALAYCFSQTIPGVSGANAIAPFSSIDKLRNDEQGTLRMLLDRVKCPPAEWLLLLDGLDEMASPYGESLFHWIRGLPKRVRVVITTRPNVIKQLGGIPHSTQFTICNFNSDQIESLVTKWFASNSDLGGALLDKITSNTGLKEPATIPLLLTCLCLLVEARGTAEFGQTDIDIARVYKWFVELLLEGWDAHRSRRPENKGLILLGMEVMIDLSDRFDFDTSFRDADVIQTISKCAALLKASRKEEEDLLTVITQPGRLLVKRADDHTYRFRLQAFWDYFHSRLIAREVAASSQGAQP